jgi:hypothetical protein
MERNQALFGDVMDTIDDMEAKGVPVPDCSDLDLSWKSNAGFAGMPSNARKSIIHPVVSPNANRPHTASHQHGTHTVTPSGDSQANGKSKVEQVEKFAVWQNVFKWEFGFSW